MKDNQVATFLNQSIAASLQSQNLRFREYWEPRVIAALTPAAGQCMDRIREGLATQRRLPWSRRNPAALRLALGASCARIVAERVADAASLLQRMVESESAVAGEALSLGGLLGSSLPPAQRHPDPQSETRRLAAVAALERVVERGHGQFMRRVWAELELAGPAPEDWARLEQSLQRLADAWQSRLATIARTVTHAAATCLRLALP
ncbi:MAG: hypothetical protein K9K66_10050 [Desulfarculaceae bacterium]|nr:hypothetical protein [Desulfarculaceae bacterium]MCF8073749.1 hypothetical protein [Desulfarculaceae bacterium]MCF8101990.1 hypothetical protein [Desulfarculaceae bacterium]MCF8115960.1 hypothetical protein [Desulfarculaceae bacterium]